MKEMLWSSQANFHTNPLTSETRDSSAFEQFSVLNDGPASIIEQLSVPNDGSAFTIEQLSVPHDGPAHFKQLSVPTTAPQAISATAATTTVIKTPVLTTMTATTKEILLKLDNCLLHPAKSAANHATSRNLLLFFVQNDPAIMIPSLLLPCNFTHPAIMTALNTRNLLPSFVQNDLSITIASSLQLIVESFSIGANQAFVCISSFKSNEDFILASEGAHPDPTICCTFKLIVVEMGAIAPAHLSQTCTLYPS